MKILLIYNPFAGFGKSEKVLPEVKQAFADKGVTCDLLLTESKGHATKLVKNANLSQYDAVVSSGGDGTFHEVLNGYYQNEEPNKPPIGIIPNGTGNAFADELGLKGFEFHKAIDIISKRNVKKIDIGYCETQNENFYFHNILGFGMVSDINQASNKYKKFGTASYTLATLEKILFLKTYPLEIVLDGKTIKQDNIFVEISNTKYTGSDFLMAPEAEIDDGFFDIVLSRKTSRFNTFKALMQIYKGTHIHNKDINYCKASSITVKTKDAKLLTPDGESFGHTPLKVTCKKQFLDFLWK